MTVNINLKELKNDQLEQLLYMTFAIDNENESVAALEAIGEEVKIRLANGKLVHNREGIPTDWDILVGETEYELKNK